MQPITAPPRDALTAADVTWLIRDAVAVETSAGCELLDMDLNVVADISDSLVDGTITRQSYADLHGSATLALEQALDWGRAIVRPFYVMRAGAVSARFNMGAYFTSVQDNEIGDDLDLYDVTGMDILDALADPVGEAYAIALGERYLDFVERILQDQGVTRYLIDQSAAASVLPSARVWPMDENTTWLTIINDLLGAVGYAGIWSDWDGYLRAQRYTSPTDRPDEWVYTVDPGTAMVSPSRRVNRDAYRTPNRWVFYRSNGVDGPAPVEGNGVFTYVNQSAGPSSVDARGGRVFTRPVPLDVADHAALVAAAQRTIDADMRTPAKVTLSTSPNPMHWHFDRVRMLDPALPTFSGMSATSWTLPLGGGDMSHEWSPLEPTLRPSESPGR